MDPYLPQAQAVLEAERVRLAVEMKRQQRAIRESVGLEIGDPLAEDVYMNDHLDSLYRF